MSIQIFLNKYFNKEDKIILACSTGPDSMYLLHKILKTSYKDNLVVCYFNHKLRKEADFEEEFIEKLGKKLGFEVEIGSADIKAIHNKCASKSIEEIAREKRYQFLNAVLNIHNAKYLLTAHHLDDKIETFFFNLFRGSKITGLINMTEQSGSILRPLLGKTKADILDYLEKHNHKYNIDNTNLDTEITRNYLRIDIIPKLGKINQNFKENIGNFMSYLENVKDFIDIEVKKFLETKDEIHGGFPNSREGNSFFSLKDFNNLNLFLQKEIIRYIFYVRNNNSTIGLSESNINEILRFINGKNNKTIKEIKMLKMMKDGDKIYY